MMLGLTKNAAIFLNTNHFGYYICPAIMCTGMLFVIEKRVLIKSLFMVFWSSILDRPKGKYFKAGYNKTVFIYTGKLI